MVYARENQALRLLLCLRPQRQLLQWPDVSHVIFSYGNLSMDTHLNEKCGNV